MNNSVIAQLITNGDYAQLHFDHRLPVLDTSKRSLNGYDHGMDLVISRPKARLRQGRLLAKRNAGQTSIEIGNPIEVYQELLGSFANIEGLIHLKQVNSYTLNIEVGKLFNCVEIGRNIAELIAKMIFQKELQLTLSQEGDEASKLQLDPGVKLEGLKMIENFGDFI
jgi:hypothetical protein